MLSIQTDYSTLTAVLGRRAHSHREAFSSAAFVADQVLRSCSSYGEDSLDALQYFPPGFLENRRKPLSNKGRGRKKAWSRAVPHSSKKQNTKKDFFVALVL